MCIALFNKKFYFSDIQVIKLDPIYESKEKFKGLNIPYKLMKYYNFNEVNKFKYTYRKDTKLNEEDATVSCCFYLIFHLFSLWFVF